MTNIDPTNILCAEALLGDPRIAQAKKLLLDAVAEHQSRLTTVKPPNPALKVSYEELLHRFAVCRGAKLWFPFLGSSIGKGPLVELLDGSVKYDFISGIGVHYWGHSHPDMIAASIDAAISDTVMQGNLQQNKDSLELSELLVKASGLDHCFLSSSGAMANENGLKIAFQKKHPASRILAFDRCFVGRTLAVSQITDKPSFREGLPSNILVDYIPYYDAADPEGSTARAAETLKKLIARYPNEHAVMIFEFVQGEGGFYFGTKQFFETLMCILKEHHIAIFADEVQTFGRTSELFAYQHFGLQSYIDLATIGKLSQVCATLFNRDFTPRPGLLSQTYTGSTSAIRACKVIVTGLMNGGFFGPEGSIARLHNHFVKGLETIASKHPDKIRGPYGIGVMVAFTPFDGDTQRVTKLVHNLFEDGVLSFIAGSNPTRVRFLLPAGSISYEAIDEVIHIIETTLLRT